jgi:hypothetical protein
MSSNQSTTQHRSITQRLQRAKSPEARRAVVTDWAANWRNEQMGLIRDLERALKADDYDQLCIATGQLKAVSEKRLSGLACVVDALTN